MPDSFLHRILANAKKTLHRDSVAIQRSLYSTLINIDNYEASPFIKWILGIFNLVKNELSS